MMPPPAWLPPGDAQDSAPGRRGGGGWDITCICFPKTKEKQNPIKTHSGQKINAHFLILLRQDLSEKSKNVPRNEMFYDLDRAPYTPQLPLISLTNLTRIKNALVFLPLTSTDMKIFSTKNV
jgi:hypothetical protein